MSKKSFVLYLDSLEILDDLTGDQTKELLIAIRDYNSGKEVQLSGLMKAVFNPFKNSFDRDLEKYNSKCAKNSENARKRWDKKDTNACERIKVDAKHADSVNDSDSVKDKDKDNVNKRKGNKPKPKINYYKEFDHLKITVEEKDKLIELKYSITQIDNILESIENYKNNKNYKSLFLTAKKWLERDQQSNYSKPSNNPNEPYKITKTNYGPNGLLKLR